MKVYQEKIYLCELAFPGLLNDTIKIINFFNINNFFDILIMGSSQEKSNFY